MKIRMPRQGSSDPLSFGPTSSRAIKDAQGEKRRVLKRLQGLIELHQESALRMDVALEAEDVLIVIEALEAEANRGDPLAVLKCLDEIREYARFTLYDEMLGEPSNVFLATPVDADTTRYEAMPRAFWLDCLGGLRKEWELKAPSKEGLSSPPTQD